MRRFRGMDGWQQQHLLPEGSGKLTAAAVALFDVP